MGRSPLSGWPMLRRLRRAGFSTTVFGYLAALESFASIVHRLRDRIQQIAHAGPYIVVGHSLGGVLLRAAIGELPSSIMPSHIYLLGSPITTSRLAIKLRANPVFKAFAGDCGQLLASEERMKRVASVNGPVTAIVGVRGFTGANSPFGFEANDGVVAVSEASAEWLTSKVELPVMHTFLPASSSVANIIINTYAADAG